MGWKRHRGHRPDGNSTDVVDELRDVGALVWPLGRPCDLLVLFRDRYFLLDVDGITKNRKRDQAQLDNFALWHVKLVKTAEEALKAIGAINGDL